MIKMISTIKINKQKALGQNKSQMLILSYFMEARSLRETVKLLFAVLERTVPSSKMKLKALVLMKTPLCK
jgi:hypothetical protein